jgi:uncharacterized protein YuzE
MKVYYDAEADVLSLRLSNARIDEGDELKPGLIISYDSWGNVVCIEILAASKHLPDLNTIEFAPFGPEKETAKQSDPKRSSMKVE